MIATLTYRTGEHGYTIGKPTEKKKRKYTKKKQYAGFGRHEGLSKRKTAKRPKEYIHKTYVLDSMVVTRYFERYLTEKFEFAVNRKLKKKLDGMIRDMAKHIVDKFEITLVHQPDIKSNKEIISIKLDDKNLYSGKYFGQLRQDK